MFDDDDLVDESNDLNNVNYNSRRGGAQAAQPVKKPAQQQQKQSNLNYNDIEFSDDDILKQSIPKQQANQKKGSDFDDFDLGYPSKNQSNVNQKPSSGLPPIQNNSGLPSINKPATKQPISLDPFYNDDDDFKPAKKKKESDVEDLDDLDDIYGQSNAKKEDSPVKNSNNKGVTEAIKSKPNFGKANIKQESNTKLQEPKKQDFEENYEDSFDDDNKQQQQKGGFQQKEEVLSSLSDLPDIEPSPQKQQEYASNNKQNNNNNYQSIDDEDDYGYGDNKESKPFSIQSKKQNDKTPSKTNLPPQPQKNSYQPLRNRNDSADRQKSKNRENSADSQRRGSNHSIPAKPANKKLNSREASNKIPPSLQSKSQPKTREPSAGKMFRMLNMKDLEKLLEEKNYENMNFKDLKNENEALREKLKSFNQQLSEKIEHNQPMIQKQAANQNSSNQTRSRSTQMRTADAEKENNIKIMKRLQDEYEKLEQRLSIVEDQGYLSKLKQQIESAKTLINKFKVDTKHIILKNDQQAKELSRIERGDGVPDSVKEQHSLKIEVQSYVDKINELEKRKEDIEDMYRKKTELIETKDKEMNEKIKEAKQLNVDVNLQSNSYKRKEKYKELQKQIEVLEKSNQTSIKLADTKESIQKRELQEIQREIQQKDDEINQMEIEIMELKNRVQDKIEREKIYSRNVRELFNRLPESEMQMAMHHHKSTDSIPRSKNANASPTPVKHNNLVSPAQSKQSSNSKPNLKFIKKEDYQSKQQLSKERKGSDIIRDEVETESINFVQKMNSKTNLNQPQFESDQKEEVISKPFNFKKNNQEARVWKPEDNQSNQQQPSPQKQVQQNNNVENTPPSFNFKKKNEQQKENEQYNKPLQQNNQQADNLNNAKQPSQTQLEPSKEQEDIYSKPQKMFKFKKDNNENNNTSNTAVAGGYNPVESMAQNNQNQQQQPQKQEEDQGYNFQANSRVSRNRNKGPTNIDEPYQPTKVEEQKQKIPNQTDAQGGGGYNPTAFNSNNNTNNNNAISGGYAFSGQQQDQNKNANQNSMNNLSDSYQPTGGVSRRRGGANTNATGEDGGYKPSVLSNNNLGSNLGGNNLNAGLSNNTNNNNNANNFNSFGGNESTQNKNNNSNSILNNDKQDDLPINAVSRRRGNQQKTDDTNLGGGYNFSGNNATNEVNNANKNDNDNKWGWNAGNDNNKLGANNNNTNLSANNNDKWNFNQDNNKTDNAINKQTANVSNNNPVNTNANSNSNNNDKWSWNSNANDNKNSNQLGTGNNKLGSGWDDNTFGLNNNNNASSNNQPVTEQPKQFNFKKKQEEQMQAKQPEPEVKATQPVQQQQPQVQQQQQQPQQIKKQDDDQMFLGPGDRRRVKKPNVAEAAKVQKRDIFGGGADNDDQPFSLAAPKEVGGTGQQQQTSSSNQNKQQTQSNNNNSNNNNKKSALDDDDDTSGLDFLKQEKPKVNYNDEDDDLFGKKPTKPTGQQPSSIGLGAKKTQEDKQEREKQLASKAQKNDFFDDLF